VRRLFVGSHIVHSNERTLAMVKPDAMKRGDLANIIGDIEAAGFTIVAQKEHQLTVLQVEEFYAEHSGKPFYSALSSFMTSGKVCALLLEKNNAVKEWRALMGPTSVDVAKETAPGCLRAKYGSGQTENATHGSDSHISAAREAAFWFPEVSGSKTRRKTTKTKTKTKTKN